MPILFLDQIILAALSSSGFDSFFHFPASATISKYPQKIGKASKWNTVLATTCSFSQVSPILVETGIIKFS